jgi:hypothetical protein
LDEEGTNDTGGIYDVAASIVDRMKLPNGTVKWIEKQEFAMNAVHIKKYETMEKDKTPLSVYRDVFRAPMTFNNAWNHPDKWQRWKWREAITKEFTKMENLKIWKKIKHSEIPKGRQCVKHKWVFEIKRNGVFQARLVTVKFQELISLRRMLLW